MLAVEISVSNSVEEILLTVSESWWWDSSSNPDRRTDGHRQPETRRHITSWKTSCHSQHGDSDGNTIKHSGKASWPLIKCDPVSWRRSVELMTSEVWVSPQHDGTSSVCQHPPLLTGLHSFNSTHLRCDWTLTASQWREPCSEASINICLGVSQSQNNK